MALTHRSFCAEHAGYESNERLEFLGDSVLGLAVTQHLYRVYPTRPEGELAPMRAAVVNSASLAEAASEIGLGESLRLGKGEDKSGGRQRPSILADAMEAVIGAVYLDGGWVVAKDLVERLIAPKIRTPDETPRYQDYKTELQELIARLNHSTAPQYQVSHFGPDHEKHFQATVSAEGKVLGRGEGRSKKQSEQNAAAAALKQLLHTHEAAAANPENDISQGMTNIDA